MYGRAAFHLGNSPTTLRRQQSVGGVGEWCSSCFNELNVYTRWWLQSIAGGSPDGYVNETTHTHLGNRQEDTSGVVSKTTWPAKC